MKKTMVLVFENMKKKNVSVAENMKEKNGISFWKYNNGVKILKDLLPYRNHFAYITDGHRLQTHGDYITQSQIIFAVKIKNSHLR